MTSPVDIRPDHLVIVQDILHKHLPEGVKVWVFGSRANWTTKDSSDLDLALEGQGKLGHKVLGALKDAFEDSPLPYTVDVVDLNRIGGSFRRIVKSQRIPLLMDGDDSGRPLSNDWREVTLGDLCEFRGGSVFKLQYQGKASGHYPFIKVRDMNLSANEVRINEATNWISQDVAKEIKAKPIPEGSIVFAKIGEALKQNRLRMTIRPTIVDNNMMGAIPKTDIVELGFLFYGMHQFDFGGIASGTALPYLTMSELTDLPISLPPLPEQRAIAHILGTLDDKIELIRRMNETLEAMARALFKSWFVDFDPVRAKIEGRWRRGESLPGLPVELYDLFPDRLADSELGELPEGWEVKRIDEIAERVAMGPFGSSIKVATFVNNGIPVISGQHLGGTLLEDNEYNYITEAHAEKLANANVRRGDIVFTHAGSIGQAAYIPQSSQFERYVISQRQFYMRCDTSKISPLFVVHYFKTREGQHQLLANTSSTGVPSIARPVTYLRSIELCVPPETTWRKFDQMVSTFHSNIACNTEESRGLATQRDALLPRLVSGEVRVGVDRESRGRSA